MSTSPFRFRLERVRELREHDEDRAREELASSLGAQLRGEAMLRAACELVADAHAAHRDEALAGVPVTSTDLHAQQLWAERLERQQADAELALERLKERRRQEHRTHSERIEGARLDEIALTVHARRTFA